MSTPALKIIATPEFAFDYVQDSSFLTAILLTADSINPAITGNLPSNTQISWSISNIALTGFDVSVSLLSSTIETIVVATSSVTVPPSAINSVLNSASAVDPAPPFSYNITNNPNGTVTITFDVTAIGTIPTATTGTAITSIPYNSEFFYKSISLFDYFPIDINTPLSFDSNYITVGSQLSVPIVSAVSVVAASAVKFSFRAQFSTVPKTHDFILSSIKTENVPFTRSLTAQIVQNPTSPQILPFQEVAWFFDDPVWATTTSNTPYIKGTFRPLSELDTLVLYTTAPVYDYKIQRAPIFASNIFVSAPITTQQKGLVWQYDGFPNLDLNLFINFERTNSSTFFYRLTSNNSYNVNIITQSSSFGGFTSNFQDTNYKGWYTINNTSQINQSTLSATFNRALPSVSSVQLYLSANTPPDSLTPWFSPHLFTRSLSAKFVPYFLNADFIGFPDSYFNTSTTVRYLNFSNYTESPGMFFYGEGHTGTVYLKCDPQPQSVTYNWTIKSNTTNYTVTAINISNLQPLPNTQAFLSSIAVRIPTTPGDNFKIPILLQLTDSIFSINDPIYYYDDVDGQLTIYPYCATTVDGENAEAFTNSRFKQSIFVLPYTLPQYNFNSGMQPIEILLADGTRKFYQSTFRLLAGPQTCYDKYGLIWNWSTFTTCRSNSALPSSWQDVECNTSARYPKKWRFEGALSAQIFNIDPLSCTAGLITWNLSSSTNWPVIPTTTSLTRYPFNIRVQDFGILRQTVSLYTPTDVSVIAQQTVTCHITASNVPQNNQWQIRQTILTAISTTKFFTTPEIKLYTPNKIVLTGTEIKFENLITQLAAITALEFQYNNQTTILTGNDINSQYFIIPGYDTLGYKTVLVTAKTSLPQIPEVATELNNVVFVTDNYDTVIPTEYQTDKEPILLPWPDKPQIGSNDWVNNDNINSCIQKIYDNLEYLRTRGQSYKDTYDEYYGYLGVPAPSSLNPSSCVAWTWEDLDPFNTPLPFTVTWKDVFYTGNDVSNGSQVGCGLWNQHIRNIDTQLPTCYGLYELDWNWKSLKQANSQTLVTWKDAKCDELFNKRWYYEPGQLQSYIVCNEGNWNVNIPNLDKYYPTIANNTIQSRCIYYGIVSKNNILYTAQKTQLKLLSSDYSATFFDARFTSDGIRQFSDLKGICLDSFDKVFVLDGLQAQITVLTYEPNGRGSSWQLYTNWGGFGGRNSNNKFYLPNDIHIDQLDNVWVTDSGNNCIKHFSNTGSWIQTITDSTLLSSTIYSVAVDSQSMLHVLTENEIRVYSYKGEFIFAYSYKKFTTSSPRKINTSYNREIIYVAFESEIIKYFRNGIYAGRIIHPSDNITNITSIYHDEFRNLLVTSNDKILKYVDTMTLIRNIGTLPTTYWNLSDMFIHQDEYVQNWVYTKTLQKLWDNIEIFKNILNYSTTDSCKQYKPSRHIKDKIVIGQNELVTSTVINRVLDYLWENFYDIVDYFDPNCKQ
jgi:hypothetical protein